MKFDMEFVISRRFCFAILAAMALPLFCGCRDSSGPQIAPISGQVLIDGQPLTVGRVEFIPAGSRASFGNLDKEGRFKLTCRDPEDGAILGNHHILVDGSEVLSSSDTMTKFKWHAPKKYASAETSGLTENITGPRDDLVINLTWDGDKPFVETIGSNSEPEIHSHYKK